MLNDKINHEIRSQTRKTTCYEFKVFFLPNLLRNRLFYVTISQIIQKLILSQKSFVTQTKETKEVFGGKALQINFSQGFSVFIHNLQFKRIYSKSLQVLTKPVKLLKLKQPPK